MLLDEHILIAPTFHVGVASQALHQGERAHCCSTEKNHISTGLEAVVEYAKQRGWIEHKPKKNVKFIVYDSTGNRSFVIQTEPLKFWARKYEVHLNTLIRYDKVHGIWKKIDSIVVLLQEVAGFVRGTSLNIPYKLTGPSVMQIENTKLSTQQTSSQMITKPESQLSTYYEKPSSQNGSQTNWTLDCLCCRQKIQLVEDSRLTVYDLYDRYRYCHVCGNTRPINCIYQCYTNQALPPNQPQLPPPTLPTNHYHSGCNGHSNYLQKPAPVYPSVTYSQQRTHCHIAPAIVPSYSGVAITQTVITNATQISFHFSYMRS